MAMKYKNNKNVQQMYKWQSNIKNVQMAVKYKNIHHVQNSTNGNEIFFIQ